ncbi:MAG TPA: beta-L-arabinofuranosidase domain-containing protein [Capsulimonadaceae bacterium]|jgi:hypothetical protein
MSLPHDIWHTIDTPSSAIQQASGTLVGGVIGHRIDITWRNNLLQLDWTNDFLRPFIEKRGTGGEYVGMGKTLDGLIKLAHHTNAPELAALRHDVLTKLIGAQLPDGYLGTYEPAARVTKVWDVHEMSYVLYALITDWKLFHEQSSLDAAIRLGDYLLTSLTPDAFSQIASNGLCPELSLIGLDRALLALHSATGDTRPLRFVVDTLHLPTWDLPIVEGRHGKIEGHAYAFLTRCVAQIELYHLTGDVRLLAQTRAAMSFLLESGGLVITGACGMSECWHHDQTGSGELGETCTTAYQIRLYDNLLRMDGSALYGDLMEVAIYNTLFAAQSPDGRQLRYYTPFDGQRKYWDRDTYCCPSNYRRIVAELPGMIAYTGEHGVLVNLYTESNINATLAGSSISLTQESNYPASGDVRLVIGTESPQLFAVNLRIPSWCNSFTVSVNGDSVASTTLDGIAQIERTWQDGDEITLRLDMPWRTVEGFATQAGKVAVMRGPVLYALDPAANNLSETDIANLRLDTQPLQSLPQTDLLVEIPAASATMCVPSRRQVLLTPFTAPSNTITYFSPI